MAWMWFESMFANGGIPMFENKEHTIVEWSLAALLVSPACLLGGCEPPVNYDEGATDDESVRFWTAYTSEEYPPLECPNGQAVQGVDCTGGYCDNVAIYCETTGRASGYSTWVPYFSEEGSGTADEGHCLGADMWLTGVNCRGTYCDDLTLRCTQLTNSSGGTCWWSGWYSEEQAPFYATGGAFIKGIECDGDYCDNKRYQFCQLL
jgi:hypothetical protein